MAGVHPNIQKILELPADPNEIPVEKLPPDEARSSFERDLASVDADKPDVFRITDVKVKGAGGLIKARVYEPSDGAGRPALVYFHGGGYIRGSIETHDSSCRVLANSSNAVIVSVDYRLAPEAKFPEPLEDCYAATVDVISRADEFGIDAGRVAIGGDSAGGNFAAALCLMARDRNGPDIRYQLLVYPSVDLGADTESVRLFSKGYMLDSMPFYVRSYIRNAEDIANPLVSPLRAEDLSGLPPAYILTCGYDPLRDEGKAYAKRLADAGVAVEEVCYEDMTHGFLLLRGIVQDEADGAIEEYGRAVGAALSN